VNVGSAVALGGGSGGGEDPFNRVVPPGTPGYWSEGESWGQFPGTETYSGDEWFLNQWTGSGWNPLASSVDGQYGILDNSGTPGETDAGRVIPYECVQLQAGAYPLLDGTTEVLFEGCYWDLGGVGGIVIIDGAYFGLLATSAAIERPFAQAHALVDIGRTSSCSGLETTVTVSGEGGAWSTGSETYTDGTVHPLPYPDPDGRFNVRIRIDPEGLRVKVWSGGEPDWQATLPFSSGGISDVHLSTVYIANWTVIDSDGSLFSTGSLRVDRVVVIGGAGTGPSASGTIGKG
jgi:hypothetical protein